MTAITQPMPSTLSVKHTIDPRRLGTNLSNEERIERVKTYSPSYYGVNTSIRRDIKRFLSVQKQWNALDSVTLNSIESYFHYHAATVRAHHHGQIEHFTPKAYKLYPEFGEIITKLMDEAHGAIEKKLSELEKAFAQHDLDRLPTLFEEYEVLFEKHLIEEEEGLLVLIERLTDEQYQTIMKEYMQEMAKDEFTMRLEWALAGMDHEARKIYLKKLPLIVSIMWALIWKRSYSNRVKVFNKFGA